MNNVTRYEFEVYEGGGEVVVSETGCFVDYDDYLSQLQQTDALQTSLNNIINAFGISGEGAHSKLVIEYVHGLVAENLAVKKYAKIDDYDKCDNCGFESYVMPIETPATDAAIAEIKAQGVDELANKLEGLPFNCGVNHQYVVSFAANLRAERKG